MELEYLHLDCKLQLEVYPDSAANAVSTPNGSALNTSSVPGCPFPLNALVPNATPTLCPSSFLDIRYKLNLLPLLSFSKLL